MNILIAYFSGTGCTELTAKTLSEEFTARGHTAECRKIKQNYSDIDSFDILSVCFPVHAFNAPEPVMNWAKTLPDNPGKPVVVISVSGGGEVTSNLACRLPLKKILTRKGYTIIYEKMITMPSNIFTETSSPLCAALLKMLPYKISFMAEEILKGTVNLLNPPLVDRILTFFGGAEHTGAHLFGKHIQSSSSCNGCSICAKHCPAGNISMEGDRPVFSSKCTMCLGCIYICPQKALSPKYGKFAVFNNGFSIKTMVSLPNDPDLDVEKEAKGNSWLGVKKYLLDTTDCMEPAHKNDTLKNTWKNS